MAVTITATKYFTGTGPIKFSEIRDTFGDLPGTNVRISDYKRNSIGDTDWEEDNTITPRVPDATENSQLPDTDDNIQLSDYRNTIKEYNVEQTGNEEERVYSDGDTTDWNNNLSKNVTKNYDVTGTIYSNETNKYALTFVEGDYNNLEINVSGNIYGEGGAAGGGNGGGALYLHNKYDGDKVRLSIANNGRIWAGGGGGVSGNDGNDGDDLFCTKTVNWSAVNRVGNTHLCNNNSNQCSKPMKCCIEKGMPAGHVTNSNNKPADVITANVKWKSANPYGNTNSGVNRSRCRGGRGGTGARGGISINTVINYAQRNSTYQCTNIWNINCTGKQFSDQAGGNGGNKGNGGAGKGWSNRNTSINSSPHAGNAGNDGNCNKCNNNSTTSCGNDGNSGNDGGDWGQAAASGGSGGIAIRKKKVILNNANPNTVKGHINNI